MSNSTESNSGTDYSSSPPVTPRRQLSRPKKSTNQESMSNSTISNSGTDYSSSPPVTPRRQRQRRQLSLTKKSTNQKSVSSSTLSNSGPDYSSSPPVTPRRQRQRRQRQRRQLSLTKKSTNQKSVSNSTLSNSGTDYSSSPPVTPRRQRQRRQRQRRQLSRRQNTSSSGRSASLSATSASSSSPPIIPMDPRLQQFLNACNKGDFGLCNQLVIADPDILLSTTPHKNNCLHIAAMLGHHDFAREVWSRAPSLISGTNDDGETPMIAALMTANLSLASDIMTAASQYMQHDDWETGRSLNRMLLMVDRCKENVLHHAMRNGLKNLALQLLHIEPRLSEQVSNTSESPMYMAARRGYSEVVERLLEIPSSADSGPNNESALYAAVRFDQIGISQQLLEGRPQLAYHKNRKGYNPLHRAILANNLEIVKILLEYDNNLAYIKSDHSGSTPFYMALGKGYVLIAEEIRTTCPDSVYTPDNSGSSALINAIEFEMEDSIDYILKTPQIHRFINQRNKNGNIPLHKAARKCNPELLRSLLIHKEQDYTAVNVKGDHAVNEVYGQKDSWKTLKWNESFTLLSNVIPSVWKHEMSGIAKRTIKKQAIEEVKSLTTKRTSNTTLVAILLATVTFAAAFTLPGGFSSDPTDAGIPIFARKAAFQVFLISDTIAMCCSLSVAFLCILATWEDLDFLLNYTKTTKALMWCAYGATALAFGTGLFTVIAPNNLWLAIFILVLCTVLPFISKIIGDWPKLMLCYRIRGHFQKDLFPDI